MQRSMTGFAALAVGAALAAPAHACAPKAAATVEVAQVMGAMYAALKADDSHGFHAVTTQDFFTFDGGKRFDSDALLNLIKAAHDRGAVYQWTISDPKVEVDCNTALITYTNIGSLTENGATRPLTWLESATLVHDGARWRIRFFHSTRAAS